jgi:sugar-phosphatase
LWCEAALEVFEYYGKKLSVADFAITTGLRTSEFVSWWLRDYKFDNAELEKAANNIIDSVIDKVKKKGRALPGTPYIFDFFKRKGFKIGLATSSPMRLADVITGMLDIDKYLDAKTSAEHLDYGKPHPQVYLDCAKELGRSPLECICFEDSFNGMLAVKAARMKCVIVPAQSQLKDERWSVADLKLSSLQNFNELHFNLL